MYTKLHDVVQRSTCKLDTDKAVKNGDTTGMHKMKNILREARLESGMSAAEVGRAINVSRSSVSAWENPKRKALPSKENLSALANLYQTTVDDLVGRSSWNVKAGPGTGGAVPIITLAYAQDNTHFHEMDAPEQASYILCPVPHTSKTRAILVEGHAMTSSNVMLSTPDKRNIVHTHQRRISSALSQFSGLDWRQLHVGTTS